MSESSQSEQAYGLLIEFESTGALVAAAEKVRDEGFRKWDAHAPFPVHGLDEAMGIQATILPWIVLGGGLVGCAGGTLMQWWMNAVDYPLIISGKPLWSLAANIPVIFECTVLLSALAAFFGMWGLNMLPQWNHPIFNSERFERATSDRFFISIEAADAKYDSEKTQAFAESLGGSAVETVAR